MKRFVVNATDRNDFYSFFMPIVCHAWNRHMGYSPIALLHGTESEWKSDALSSYILDHLLADAVVSYVADVPGFRVSTVMQVSRLFAHTLPGFGADDYILTSDVDMIPLSHEYFSQQDPTFLIHLFGANAYADISKGEMPPKFPMCYIGGPVWAWRDVLGTSSNLLHQELSSALAGREDGWNTDEEYFAAKLQSHAFYRGPFARLGAERFGKGRCECITRHWTPLAYRRIDRAAWAFQGEEGLIDCHAHRPGYESPEVLIRLLEQYFPESGAFFSTYLEGFLKRKECHV